MRVVTSATLAPMKAKGIPVIRFPRGKLRLRYHVYWNFARCSSRKTALCQSIVLIAFTAGYIGVTSKSGKSTSDIPSAAYIKCSCVESGHRIERSFLAQDYDVCPHVCTGSGEFASSFDEAKSIALGLDVMRKSAVEVCILCRDVAPTVENIYSRIVQLGTAFRRAHITIVENDSLDGSAQALRNIADRVNRGSDSIRVTVESFILGIPRGRFGNRWLPSSSIYDSPSFASRRAIRYHRMSLMRNQCLLQALKRDEVDFYIVMDADEDLNSSGLQIEGISHSFGLRGLNWNVMCANGISTARGNKRARLRLYRNASEMILPKAFQWTFWDTLAYRDAVYNETNWRAHENVIHSPYDAPFMVDSCFGGLAIYDLRYSSSWRKCSYEGHVNNSCEHISFNRCLQQSGWNIYFNPRMLLEYKRVFSTPHEDVSMSHIQSRLEY